MNGHFATTFIPSDLKLTVITPGRYRLNKYLWDEDIVDAVEVAAGFVGIVKSNVHANIDFGTLKAKKPEKCEPVALDQEKSDQRIDAPIVPVGCTYRRNLYSQASII